MVPSEGGATSTSRSQTIKEWNVSHPGGSMKKIRPSYISPKGVDDRRFQ